MESHDHLHPEGIRRIKKKKEEFSNSAKVGGWGENPSPSNLGIVRNTLYQISCSGVYSFWL